jgi:hypothetical protein
MKFTKAMLHMPESAKEDRIPLRSLKLGFIVVKSSHVGGGLCDQNLAVLEYCDGILPMQPWNCVKT